MVPIWSVYLLSSPSDCDRVSLLLNNVLGGIIMIKHINDMKEFNEFINEGTVLVDFFATWCGPCKMLSPVIEGLEREHPELKVVKVDVDEAVEIAMEYKVQAIPTLYLVKDGKVVNHAMGYMNKNQLENFINK